MKTILYLLLVFILLLAIGAVGSYYGYRHFMGESIEDTNENAKKTIQESSPDTFAMNKTTYIYAKNGKTLAKLSVGQSSNYLKYEEIPEDVVHAFVAVEDRTFWENNGVDPEGIVRAVYTYVKTKGEVAQGASTITQQLVRTSFLSPEKRIKRKINEIFLAYHMTQRYSKEEIMEYYVNNCCFANNIYGIKDAASAYLGKDVKDLTLGETAYLCAIPNRPQYYDPYESADTAMKRRNKILKDMLTCEMISQEEYDSAVAEPTPEIVRKKSKIYNYTTSTAIFCATEYLMKMDGFDFQYQFETMDEFEEYKELYDQTYEQAKQRLYTGGYKIHTTIDMDVQKKVQLTINDFLSGYKEKKDGIYNVQGSITVIDNRTHKIIANAGGRGVNDYTLNRSFQSFRQPGSTIKPLIVYTPALDTGKADANTTLKNVEVKEAYENRGNVKSLQGKSMSFRSAVTNSINGCALYLYDQVGVQKGLSYLQKMQFRRIVPNDYNLSAGLGGFTYGTNTMEMANAYSTLANHGKYTKADCIECIIDADGVNIYKDPKSKRIYSKAAADEMTDVLQDVIKYGTARNIGWNNEKWAAGKTGTTNDTRDGWFCGYTEDYTASVWVGKDDHGVISGLYGGTIPANMWKNVMEDLSEE